MFKEGDKVRYVGTSYFLDHSDNKIGRIASIFDGIHWPIDVDFGNYAVYRCSEDELELVEADNV